MSFFKTLTQGGQVHIHQLHMLKQVIVTGSIVAFIVGSSCFIWTLSHLPQEGWRALSQTLWAEFMISTNPSANHAKLYQEYIPPQGKPYLRSCLSILKDPFLGKTSQQMKAMMVESVTQSLKWSGLSFIALMGLWFFLGKGYKRAHHRRGNTLVSSSKLARFLRRRREASDLTLGPLPLIKDKETSHTLITGTTGSGKTNAFHTLLPQLRKRGDKAVIVDVTGTYVSRYYNKKTDFILNPLDTRSQSWNPWADCHLESHYDVLSECFIPENHQSRDPFWDNAARAIFKTALRKYASQEIGDIEKLTNFLLTSSEKEFDAFFKGTEAATFTSKNNEKTTQSIRSVLSSHLEGLRQLENMPDAFSIREWVMNPKQKGWLFITARSDQRQALKPLISAWVDIAINALMVLPENHARRLWFIIDELPSLQKLPCLQLGLAEGRKYGGCFVVGFQSKPQLEDIYGRSASESMLDLFNTKIFFRCTEPSTQNWVSKILGDKEESEPQENISYGAHSMRDGVSLTRHTHQKPLILPAELSQLKDLECYAKLPGDYPCTKFKMSYQTSRGSSISAFLLKPEKRREYLNATPSEEEQTVHNLIFPEVSKKDEEELV